MLEINPVHPQPRRIERIVESLRYGGLIAFPTDSTYGIGCDLYNRSSIDKLYQIKQRDKKSPFSFLCSDLSDLAKYANVGNRAYKLIRRLTPGPFTFILDATRLVPKILRTKRYTVGIRVPDNVICNAIIQGLNSPIISTTAKSSDDFLADPWQIRDIYGEHLDYVVDGGLLIPGLTTIVDLTGSEFDLIRQGKGEI
ncbi:threonylcarbamoyl-AMP synthase [bacterium]|nr:threonylcarbamoyl-AMP synthase [bacterium]